MSVDASEFPLTANDQLRLRLRVPGPSRIVKHGHDGRAYEFHLDDGTVVQLGTAKQLFDRRRFEAQFLSQARLLIPEMRTREHRNVIRLIEVAAEEFDSIASINDETRQWLSDWTLAVTNGEPCQLDVRERATAIELLSSSEPTVIFRDPDGCLYVRAQALADWINVGTAARTSLRDVSLRLRWLGFRPEAPAVREGTVVYKKRYWASAAGFADYVAARAAA